MTDEVHPVRQFLGDWFHITTRLARNVGGKSRSVAVHRLHTANRGLSDKKPGNSDTLTSSHPCHTS